jgi:hypothetical protein
MSDWERLDAAGMSERLRGTLAGKLPGREAQRVMAHSLAYGRHHGPVPDGARRAAVVVALEKRATGWFSPAILRPDDEDARRASELAGGPD